MVIREYFSLRCSKRLARNFRTAYDLSDTLESLRLAGLAGYRAVHLYKHADLVQHSVDQAILFAATGGRFPVLFLRCTLPYDGFDVALLDPVVARFALTLLRELDDGLPAGP